MNTWRFKPGAACERTVRAAMRSCRASGSSASCDGAPSGMPV